MNISKRNETKTMTEQQIDHAIALKLAELKMGKKEELTIVPMDDEIQVTVPTDIWGN